MVIQYCVVWGEEVLAGMANWFLGPCPGCTVTTQTYNTHSRGRMINNVITNNQPRKSTFVEVWKCVMCPVQTGQCAEVREAPLRLILWASGRLIAGESPQRIILLPTPDMDLGSCSCLGKLAKWAIPDSSFEFDAP